MRNKNIVVVDIDGTIANIGDRVEFLKQEPKDYDSFYASCFDDYTWYMVVVN